MRFLSESRRAVRGGRRAAEEWTCEGKQNGVFPSVWATEPAIRYHRADV